MNRELVRSTAFIRAVRRYSKKHPGAAETIEVTLRLLSEDAFNVRLNTHKLKADLEGVWACSAGYDLRILFEFVTLEKEDVGRREEAILLLTMGTHDEVY